MGRETKGKRDGGEEKLMGRETEGRRN